MTQQPFTRPGAIDLSALKRPAAPPPSAGAGAGPTTGSGPGAGAASYSLEVTEQNFQEVIERSMTAPVLLVLFSRSRMPESGQLADDVATLAGEFEGRFLAGLVDVDASPGIAQAMQVQSIPLVVAVLDGRPAPLFQDVVPMAELRTALTQVMQQLATQGMTARHQPLTGAPAEPTDDGEEQVDPRYAAAQDALAANDIDGAVAEYQKLVDANPADAEAAAGLAMAKVLQRT
ncbi:MAG: co-chaperone YbbN, partial [Nocardioides sp.]|nr:co-chaperone YbbN [Nocardioides sp.]